MIRRRSQARHWRTTQALMFERVVREIERRGLALTIEDFIQWDRWATSDSPDSLFLRQLVLRYGGKLEPRNGKLQLISPKERAHG